MTTGEREDRCCEGVSWQRGSIYAGWFSLRLSTCKEWRGARCFDRGYAKGEGDAIFEKMVHAGAGKGALLDYDYARKISRKRYVGESVY